MTVRLPLGGVKVRGQGSSLIWPIHMSLAQPRGGWERVFRSMYRHPDWAGQVCLQTRGQSVNGLLQICNEKKHLHQKVNKHTDSFIENTVI